MLRASLQFSSYPESKKRGTKIYLCVSIKQIWYQECPRNKTGLVHKPSWKTCAVAVMTETQQFSLEGRLQCGCVSIK